MDAHFVLVSKLSIIGVWGLLACVLSIQRGPLSQYILFLRKCINVHVDQEAGQVNIIGASLSEPHTSRIALH